MSSVTLEIYVFTGFLFCKNICINVLQFAFICDFIIFSLKNLVGLCFSLTTPLFVCVCVEMKCLETYVVNLMQSESYAA